jgi:methylmalonyl-CoA/ethylmalonyl-CoA epimerase
MIDALKDCKLDHIAMAVENLEDGKSIYSQIGLIFKTETEIVESQNVEVAFAQVDTHSKIELLAPLSSEGPIAKYLEKSGPGIHHICFRVKNVVEKSKELVSLGHKLIYPDPIVGAGGHLVNFIHPKSAGGVLIELSQEKA